MEALATVLFLIALSTWVGTIVFQSAIVAPAVFVALEEDSARRFLRTLFPRFYRLGIVCGALMIAALIALGMVAGWSDKMSVIAALSAIMLLLEIISLQMVPAINAARDAGKAGATRFQTLHRSSVGLTVIVLLLGLSALFIVGASTAAGWVS